MHVVPSTEQNGESRLQNAAQQCVLGQPGTSACSAQKPETHCGMSGTHESPSLIIEGAHKNCEPSHVQVWPAIGHEIISG
jgi:hypothetical protein